MLVFASDIHLTDGSLGDTVESGAFQKFFVYLKDMAETAKAKDVEVVLLGDIFDVIRSDHWLDTNIRPWSKPDEKDGEGKGLEDYAVEIVKRICNETSNKDSMEHLKRFKNEMKEKKEPVTVKFTYIPGNHDWLVNRYGKTRTQVAAFLDMQDPEQYENESFSTGKLWEDYKVFARHGDVYDPFNFDGDRDASSLGDAIVIDLVNRFPLDVQNAIGKATDPDLITQLKEIDTVRPLVDMPLWIDGACSKAVPEEIGDKVKEVWNDLVDSFLQIPFVKQHDRRWRIDVVNQLQLGLRITKLFSFRGIANLPLSRVQRKTEDSYTDKAFREEHMVRNEAEFVLYGHTHEHKIQPLDWVPLSVGSLHKTYLNTGTWRKIHVRTAFDVENREFFRWHVMTFIAFYLEGERKDKKDRRFEVWNGALG